MTDSFDTYIGVDWSGAKGPGLPGFKVARCDEGLQSPMLVENPDGGGWTRPAFVDWLASLAGEGDRLLCGMDFSFCFPYCDHDSYFPGQDFANDALGFWGQLEELCKDDEALFGGQLAEDEAYRAHFNQSSGKGASYERRLRAAETATQEQGLGTPESVFNLVGARQVGKSSLAGMRVLHRLRSIEGVAVWPFDQVTDAQTVLVETFPTAFVRMAGAGQGKVRDFERLNEILNYFSTLPVPTSQSFSDDEADALITAAALRHLALEDHLWHPKGLSDRVRRYEGWTFGVS